MIFMSLFLLIQAEIKAQSGTPFRGVLLEYFLGQRCGNCPPADSLVNVLKVKYGDSVAFVNIHSGYFAIPTINFPTDLRCATGIAIDSFFHVGDFGIPSGLVNRYLYNDTTFTHIEFINKWDSLINSMLRKTPVFAVDHHNQFNTFT